jgi:hypothetical protein
MNDANQNGCKKSSSWKQLQRAIENVRHRETVDSFELFIEGDFLRSDGRGKIFEK